MGGNGKAAKSKLRTSYMMKLHICDESDCEDGWFPATKGTSFVPSKLTPFTEISRSDGDGAVHFFLDDYRFERLWNNPNAYLGALSKFEAVLSPDFSTYTDMPRAMQVHNEYRKRVLANAFERCGMEVIPTVSWSTPDMFDVLMHGLPRGGTVAVSTRGCLRDKEARRLFEAGFVSMMEKIDPSTVIVYGCESGFDFGDANVVAFDPRSNRDGR